MFCVYFLINSKDYTVIKNKLINCIALVTLKCINEKLPMITRLINWKVLES